MSKFFSSIVIGLMLLAGLALKEPKAVAGEHEPATSSEPITIRLVHPDRQAAAMLRRFEGCAAAHPAAALAAWKRSTRDPGQLGKPLEAVISFFNPEMVQEWGVFHDARFQLGFDPETGLRRWRLAVPGDDGTLAALVTAMRLSGGSDEPPVGNGMMAVNRLGGPLAAVAVRGARGVVLASSRAELDRNLSPGIPSAPTRPEAPHILERAGPPVLAGESGLLFQIEPGRLTVPAHGTVATRRLIELARGLGCRLITGSLGLVAEHLDLEIASRLEPVGRSATGDSGSLAIDPHWLTWIPAQECVIVASLATGRGVGYWDGVFALADRVDRADPARANLAPLRTRINLLASAVGARIEADLWPHLHGVTVAWLANPENPEQSGCAVAVLQMDHDRAAAQLVSQVLPRLATLWGGAKGRPGGRPLEFVVRGQLVLIGWGDRALETMLRTAEHPEQSVEPLIGAAREGLGSEKLTRLGAYWPGRMRLPVKGLDGPTPLVATLAQGPPIVWTGWSRDGEARDRVRWQDLHGLVRRFLDAIPLQPPTTP